MNKKIIPLKDINDDQEFWRGTRFRLYNIGLKVENKEDDYYEYMLAEAPGEREYMLLVCVEGHKSGAILTYVSIYLEEGRKVVKAKTLKDAMGIEDSYLIEK